MLDELPEFMSTIEVDYEIKKYYPDCNLSLAKHLFDTKNKRLEKDFIVNRYPIMLNLAPYDMSGSNLCKYATKDCITVCVGTIKHHSKESKNMGRMGKRTSSQLCIDFARIKRSLLYLNHREYFFHCLIYEIIKRYEIIKKTHPNLEIAIRLNGYSDILWEDQKIKITSPDVQKAYKNFCLEVLGISPNSYTVRNIFELFPNIEFYDYTKYDPIKSERKRSNIPQNYHLTFSLSERKIDKNHIEEILEIENIAIVVVKEEKEKIIDYINNSTSFDAINGDEYDCRIEDGEKKLVILEAIQDGRKVKTDFVKSKVDIENLLNS
jgi:hypothetical protein